MPKQSRPDSEEPGTLDAPNDASMRESADLPPRGTAKEDAHA